LVACDIYRPAAINQLHVVGGQIGVEVYSEPENKNPVEIAQNAIKHAKANGFNVVIIDTAGRLAVDEEMMNEIANVHKAIQPQETLFVVDAMTGQDAVNTAKAFNDRLNFDGVILTKLDGDTRERRKEFREKIMDSPVFCFHGVEVPVINERVGRNHIRGIHIRPEYPVFSTKAPHATFILSNHSGGDLTCGEHYYLTFEDEKGTWRELPINAAFWDIAYVLRDGEERVMKASLYPDVHPNKPGRYRYFYEITIRRKPVLMMAEFRLTDNEEEWRTAEKTSLPPYVSDAGKGGSPQLITEEPMEEPVYKVVEVMPEFPGGMKALMDFIQKNVRYPEEARKNGIQGRVAVSVVIDENGRVTDPVIMRSRYPALDEEALRIVELMPQWKPGMQQGKAVKVEFTFPVTFKLE
jgi:TonB family protein